MKKYWIVIVVITIITIITYSIYLNAKIRDEREKQKIELQRNLDSIMIDHDKVFKQLNIPIYNNDGNIFSSRIVSILETIRIKDSIIQSNAIEIKKLIETKYEYGIALRKIMRLQKITQYYVSLIDSLYTENEKLKLENDSILNVSKYIKNRNFVLIKNEIELKDKIENASNLKAYDISIITSNVKINGKEKITDKSNRINKIELSFVIGENSLISDKKIIIIKIIYPNNKIIEQIKNVNYKGQSIKIKIDFLIDKKLSLIKGAYIVNINCDLINIGEKIFYLK